MAGLPEQHLIRVEESYEEGTYVVRAELPGIDPEKDVEITYRHRSEFRYGSFTRSLRLLADVREQDITAGYDNGVLTVKAPVSTEEAKPTRHISVFRDGEEPEPS